MNRRLLGATLLLTLPGMFAPGSILRSDAAEVSAPAQGNPLPGTSAGVNTSARAAAVGATSAEVLHCLGKYRRYGKLTHWAWRTPVMKDPDQGVLYVDDEQHVIRFSHIADLRYNWCPRGKYEDYVMAKSFRFCYGSVKGYQSTFQLFDGWTARFDVEDDERSNTGTRKIPDAGKAECRQYVIPLDKRKWLRMSQRPGYEVKWTLNIHLKKDQPYMMTHRMTPFRFIKPSADPLDVWHPRLSA